MGNPQLTQLIKDVETLKTDMAWLKKLVFIAASGSIGTIITAISSPIIHAMLK